MSNLERLRRDLSSLLKRALEEGWDSKTVVSEVQKLFKKYNLTYESKLNLSANISKQSEFKTLGSYERKQVEDVMADMEPAYSKAKNKVRDGVVSVVRDGLRNDKTFEQIRAGIENKIGSYRSYDKGVTKTAISAFQQISHYQQVKETGIKEKEARYRYVGQPAERDFCRSLMARCAAGETFTMEQIKAMDNGQGLPVEIYGGGYNCTHMWELVT